MIEIISRNQIRYQSDPVRRPMAMSGIENNIRQYAEYYNHENFSSGKYNFNERDGVSFEYDE